MFKHWLKRLTSTRSGTTYRKPSPRRGHVLTFEPLETREQPAALAWSVGATLPVATGGLAALPQGAGLLVLGGAGTTSYNLSATDPSWQAALVPTVQSLDFARSSPGVAPLPNGDVLVYGGSLNGFATPLVTQYDPNTATVTDGATNQTRALRPMSTPRAAFGAATNSANGLSYAIGGRDNNGTPLSTVEAYNPTANTWALVASLPQSLYSESAVSDGAGHLYTFGGVGADGTVTNRVYRYTVATNTWDQSAAAMPVAVRDAAAVAAPNGQIYVIGGATASGTTAAVESYNPATNAWTVQSSLPQALSSVAATVDSLGRIEVLGGYDASGNPAPTIYVSQRLNQADTAPTITSTAIRAAVVNAPYSYQVLSTGNPQPTYALTSAPAGMTIDINTGLISWTPTYATEGSATVTVVASSSVGQASQTFSIGVAPQTPTGLTGTGVSTTAISLSWNASADPNVTGYNVYRRTFVHNARGSGGTYHYGLIAGNVASTSVTISGTGVAGSYLISAVNGAGVESARTGVVTAPTLAAPVLFTAMTLSGADISSQTLSVGETGQIYLVQEFANPAPTFSLVSGPSGISVDPTSGLVTYTPGASDIGTQDVTFAATNSVGTSQYHFVFDVEALKPTVTLSAPTGAYDGTPHGATATAIDAAGNPVSGSFAFTYDGATAPPIAAGSYQVVATFTSSDPSYADASVSGTLTVDPAAPAINLSTGPFNFDGTAHGAAATATGVDGVTPVAGSFQFTYNGDPAEPTAPGLYAVVATFTSNDPNYASITTTGNLIINSPGTAVPSVSLTDGSAVYDGNPHGDSAAALAPDGSAIAGNFIITYNGETTAPSQAGTYDVVATFISSDPAYANATVTGVLTIGPAAPTLSVDQNPFVYDGTGRSAIVSAPGVDGATPVSGTIDVTYNGSATLPVDAGTYDVEVTFTSNDPNYASTTLSSSITILPAITSVGLADGAWYFTYDGTPKGVTGSATGVGGVTPVDGTFAYQYFDASGAPLAGAPTDAGYYTFTISFTSNDPNYTDGTYSWDLRIDPASPTLSYNGGPLTYNGAAQPGAVTAVGVDGVTPVAGSVTYATYNGSTTVPSTAGTYAVVAEWTSSDPNYYGSGVEGTLVINKATPVFSGLASPVVNLGASTVTLSGHIAAGVASPGGDDVAITVNGVTVPVSIGTNGNFTTSFNITGLAAGTYPVTYTFLGDGSRFGAAATGTGTLTVRSTPVVLTNPSNQTAVAGNSVTFSATASGYPAPTVQWQVSTNGTTYTNIAGATGTTYTISAAAAGQNGYKYRAVFTNSAGSATTTAATLTVQYAPVVTTNPSAKTVNAGQAVTYTAAASGNPTPTVQWQLSTDGGNTFTNIAGATGTSLTLATTTSAQNGSVYRAVFTNAVGSTTTTSALLTVRFAPVVTSDPGNQSVSAGRSVTFSASASGNPAPTVQWQVSTDGGATYTNVAGATSASLTLTSVTARQNGYRYRAVFTNSLGTATTKAATLTVL